MKVVSRPGDGHAFQCEFSGCVLRHPTSRRCCGKCNLEEGIKVVKGCQCVFGNWNPRNPRTHLAQCLFRRIASRLKNGARDLRLFLAFGTRLDQMGIDCFFENQRQIVTVDLTVSPDKVDTGAHVIITRDHFLRDKHYGVADEIARKLSIN